MADADSDGARVPTPSGPPPSPFCAAARANAEAIRPLNAMASGGARPESLTGTVDEVRRTGAELLRLAPDDIRTDVERTVQAVNLQLDVLVANNGDAAAIARDPDLVARLSSPELTGAGERYRTYVNRNCTALRLPRHRVSARPIRGSGPDRAPGPTPDRRVGRGAHEHQRAEHQGRAQELEHRAQHREHDPDRQRDPQQLQHHGCASSLTVLPSIVSAPPAEGR